MKLSFKKEARETGLSGVVNPSPRTQIKGDKFQVGHIIPPHYSDTEYKWKVSLAIVVHPSVEKPAPFQWITFKARFGTEKEAREWVTQMWATLTERYSLYQFKD